MKCPNCDKVIPSAAVRCPYCNYLIDKRYRIVLHPQKSSIKADDLSLTDGSNFKNLMAAVLSVSNARTWEAAVREWDIVDCEEDASCKSRCVCGKENIRYLFTIRNRSNKNTLFPIGSSCIRKFDRDDLNEEVGVREGMFRLLRAIRDNQFIALNAEFFSRKLLKALYEKGAFLPNQYNDYDGEKDYLFMLDMFNKRKRPSDLQQRKVRAIIVASIKPFLERELAKKMRDS